MVFKGKYLFGLLLAIAATLSISTCEQLFEVGLGEEVDIGPPSLEILAPENGQYATGTAAFELSYSDDAQVSSLEIYVGESEEAFTVLESLPALSADEVYAYDLDSTAFDDGEIEVRIVATDSAGKSAEKKIFLFIDNRPPTVLVTSPSGADADQFNDIIAIRGEAHDDAGIAGVTVAVYDSDGNEIELLDASGSSTETNIAVAVGSNAWTYRFPSKSYTGAAETYRFVITATDKAGAKNTHFFYDEDIRAANNGSALTVEQLYRLEGSGSVEGQSINSASLSALSRDRLNLSVNQNLDSPTFEFSSPSGENDALGEGASAIGTVRDDDGVSPSSIEIRFDSGDWMDVAATTGSGISVSWEYSLADLAEGQHTVAVRATDINGLTATSDTISFIIDSGVPIISIDTPSAGAYLNQDFTISGTASDTVGIAEIQIREGNTADYTAVTTFDVDTFVEDSGTKIWAWSHTVTVPVDGSKDGNRQFRIKAVDTSGKTSSENLQVFIDSEQPVVTFLGISDGETVNGDLLLQGTTQNVSPISSLTLDVAGGTQTYVLDDTVNELDTDPISGNDSTVFRWYKSLDTTSLSDGSVTVTMTALDAAGNTRTATLTINVDQTTDVPIVFFDNVDKDGAATDNAFFGSASIIGRIVDDDGVDASSVEIRVDSGSWSSVGTISGSGFSVNWEHILDTVAEGTHTFEIRGADINGVSVASQAVNFLIDNGAPTISITTIQTATQTLTSNFQGSYVNGPFQIAGVTTDGFGVDHVEIEINSSGTFVGVTEVDRSNDGSVETVTWEFDVDTASMTDGTISLRARSLDHTGKTANSDIELLLDTSNPVVEYILPAAGATVNGTVLVSGTASDANKIDAVYYFVTDAGSEPPVSVSTGTGWQLLSQLYSWSTQIDTRLLTDSSSHTVHVVAIDSAGNRSDDGDSSTALERTFVVNQSTDVPTVAFDAISGVPADNLFTTSDVITGQLSDDDAIDTGSLELRAKIGSGAFGAWQYVADVTGLSTSGTGRYVNFSLDIGTSTFAENPNVQTIEIRVSDTDPDGAGAVISDAATASFYIDNTSPTLTETTIGTTAQVIRNADFTIAGSATDSNAIDEVSISATKDGADQGVLFTATSGGAYSYLHTVDGAGSDDAVWVFSMSAADAAGRTDSTSRTVLVDATAPDTPTIDPFAAAYMVTELIASGATADSGSGLDSVEYSIDYTDDGNDANDTWGTTNGTEAWFTTVDISSGGANLPEGSHTLFVRATDRAGNVSIIADRTFLVDRNNPSLVINGFASTEYKNANFTIDGTITDSVGLDASPIAISVTGPSGPVDLTSFAGTYDDSAVPPTWSQEIPVSVDGEYTITITATDSAGRTSTAIRTVIADSTPPVIEAISNLADSDLVQNLSYTVSGSASDVSGSGVAVVEYQFRLSRNPA